MALERCNSQDSCGQVVFLSEAEVTAELLSVKLHEPVSISSTGDSHAVGSMFQCTLLALFLHFPSLKSLKSTVLGTQELSLCFCLLLSIKRSVIYFIQPLSDIINNEEI